MTDDTPVKPPKKEYLWCFWHNKNNTWLKRGWDKSPKFHLFWLPSRWLSNWLLILLSFTALPQEADGRPNSNELPIYPISSLFESRPRQLLLTGTAP